MSPAGWIRPQSSAADRCETIPSVASDAASTAWCQVCGAPLTRNTPGWTDRSRRSLTHRSLRPGPSAFTAWAEVTSPCCAPATRSMTVLISVVTAAPRSDTFCGASAPHRGGDRPQIGLGGKPSEEYWNDMEDVERHRTLVGCCGPAPL